jgi:hypothetical protein
MIISSEISLLQSDFVCNRTRVKSPEVGPRLSDAISAPTPAEIYEYKRMNSLFLVSARAF